MLQWVTGEEKGSRQMVCTASGLLPVLGDQLNISAPGQGGLLANTSLNLAPYANLCSWKACIGVWSLMLKLAKKKYRASVEEPMYSSTLRCHYPSTANNLVLDVSSTGHLSTGTSPVLHLSGS